MISAADIKEEKNETEHQQVASGAKRDSNIAVNQNQLDKVQSDPNAGGDVNGMITASKTSDPQPSKQSLINDLILSFETRNAIIHHLTAIPIYLFGPPIDEAAKARLVKESNDLILSLASLPLRNQSKSNPEQSAQESSLLLDITWDFKSRMVSCLASNLSYTVFYGNSVSIEAKNKLIEENNRVINDLLNLPIRAKNEPIRKRDSNDNLENNAAEVEQPPKRIKLEEKVDRMGQIIDEATFSYELKNAASVLEAGERHMIDRSFCCRGIEWTLMLDFKTDAKAGKFLSIYLCTQDDKVTSDWQIKGSYEIKILNQSGNEPVVRKDTVTFRNAKFSREYAWGYTEFVKLKEMIDPRKGFLKNDTLVFEVYLKADRMVLCD